MNEFILYNTDDGKAEIKIILDNNSHTIWLSQKQMAELFDVKVHTINEHIKNIYAENELDESSTIRDFRIVQREGSREVEREVSHYNLKLILSVGYRISSSRGTQFRKWATSTLEEYLVKGFVMNDERLKDPKGWDYFDELLERIRDIRASEKRFYQKVKDLFSQTSVDYDPKSDLAKKFFQTIQNKLLYAETGMTAAELILNRADGDKPNMGLTSWKGDRVRKGDIETSKNYLVKDEISNLNRLVTMFLDYAEDKAARKQQIKMEEWIEQTDKFLAFNERAVLTGAGSVSHDRMTKYVDKEFEKFTENRKLLETKIAEDEFSKEVEVLIKKKK